MSLSMSPLPNRATEEIREAHDLAILAIFDVEQYEKELRKARKMAKQRIIRYENLVLELQGQMSFPLEDADG